jgi:hypothetical protein
MGSGMFNSPNTAAMMGAVPAHRRGIAAGARMMLQNTGAVLSIAFVLAVITNAVPRDTLLQIFSGLASGLSDVRLAPFIHNMHTALWVLALTSVVGAVVCVMRPAHVAHVEVAPAIEPVPIVPAQVAPASIADRQPAEPVRRRRPEPTPAPAADRGAA